MGCAVCGVGPYVLHKYLYKYLLGGEILIRLDISRCDIFSEFTKEQQLQYFSVCSNKVVHNIDTFYYSVMLNEDAENNITEMIEYLAKLAADYKAGTTEILVGDLSFFPFRFSIYEYCLRLENMFDIFISSYLPNPKTPRVVVQLRSVGLWIDGIKPMIEQSLNALKSFLLPSGIEIVSINENRIDYAYHTNIIQNTTKYFSDNNMLESLRTSLEIYHKVGNIGRTIEVDYFSLGNRKSNNVFFRAYNKTKEVVEKNYKGFFIQRWFQERLISVYDKWCLERAYQLGTFNGLLIARIEWYLEYGTSDILKKSLVKLKRSCYTNSDNSSYISEQIDGVLPNVTTVCNIEFQTKRKFYHTMENFISNLPCSVELAHPLHRLYQIVENPKCFLNYLTYNTVSFVTKTAEGEEPASWWKRIISVKIGSNCEDWVVREYARNLDKEKLKQRMVGSMASNSVYTNGVNSNEFMADFSDMLCLLNDNDVCSVVLDGRTGEMLDFHYRDYETVKKRKNRQLKAFFKNKDVKG